MTSLIPWLDPGDRVSERGELLTDLGVQVRDVGAGLVDTRQHAGQ